MNLTVTTPDLFDICANRHRGDRESIAARERVSVERDRSTVLNLIAGAPNGMTLDEIAVALQRSPNCLSGRVTELRANGLIVASGERRETRTGCKAKVWRVKGAHGS